MRKTLLLSVALGLTSVGVMSGQSIFREHGFNRVSVGYLDYRLMECRCLSGHNSIDPQAMMRISADLSVLAV